MPKKRSIPKETVFVLTGCASGIGLHLANALIQRGHRVIATDVRLERLEQHAEDHQWPMDRVRLRRLDVCDPIHWGAVMLSSANEFGGLNVLLNIAGYLYSANVEFDKPMEVHKQVDINLKGVIFGTQAAARQMLAQEQQGGHIINIASVAGLGPVPGFSVYAATKSAVRSYSLSAAMELQSKGIAVTVVCPDTVDTPMLHGQIDNPQAALMFAAPKILTVTELENAILKKVLIDRPFEFHLPPARCRIARLANAFPSLAMRFVDGMMKRGRIKQSEMKANLTKTKSAP